ncbi:hypothetical protein Syun_016210 [Stephania yunnanensis]|uniref:Uncharacterized protein n=1 Tax=Stephania yunnanensis TaxID=152371 RepID=A0AAP0J6R5_9MAGN
MTSLKTLLLGLNDLTGPIPDVLANFTSLECLDLEDNHLEGPIPLSFGAFCKLKELSLSRNNISGEITEFVNGISLCRPNSLLETLELEQTKLTGPLFPSWLRNLNQLGIIMLENVGISDKIPNWFPKMYPSLQFLDLSNNQISGKVPLELRNGLKSTEIVLLNLRGNLFTGTIPSNMNNETMPNLQFLTLSKNLIEGSIPSSICNLKQLRTVSLSSNNLSGELPQECWKDLESLEVIDLSNNHLSGKMGKRLPHLEILRLRSNSFSGFIHEHRCLLHSLRILDLAHNGLSGTIPHCFGNFSGMATVDPTNPISISPMAIHGQEFVDQVNMQITKGIELEYNGTLAFLKCIDLSHNAFSGEIPTEITGLLGLSILNLSINQLTGRIPEKIGSMQRLEVLDLSRNQLSGSIPPSISALNSLNHLNLSSNNLSGRIPSGYQLQTLPDPSIYAGNPGLCGAPLKDCATHPDIHGLNHEEDKEDWLPFFISMSIGFVVGFWSVCGSLLLNKSWRYAFFRFIDNMTIIPVCVVVKARSFRLGRNRNAQHA